jgi:asparagine synthase (glutamine-hydrolysing)
MCGINGIFSFKNKEEAVQQVRRMNQCIAHRGPDSEGIWANENCVLGHRRLSIIDTSEAGNQPFFSADKKLSMVYNGEIYNYIELKQELSSEFTFTTASDTEVIIAAYKKWGIKCIEKFFGMFAFALWDEDLQALFVVRDRLGVKPLYYSQQNSQLIFSSELRAVMSTGLVRKKIGQKSIVDYLRYQTVHAPNTIIEDVKMLMPGHYMKITSSGIATTCFWDQEKNATRGIENDDIKVVRKNIHDLMRSSVEIRMRADVPFGAFLSGGIDSSIIVGLMSEISSHQVKTFSITFHEKEFDESPYSELIANKFKTDHHPIKLHADDFLKLVPEALRSVDHPSGDGPNTYVVSKVTREAGVKMALSGLGGDEVFAGYEIFKRIKKLESGSWINMLPLGGRKVIGEILRKVRPSISSEKIADILREERIDFAHFYPHNREVLPEREVEKLLRNKNLPTNVVSELTEKINKSDLELLSKVSIAEMSTYMQNVLLRDADQMSMAHALEVRVPFLDHRLIEYVLGVGDKIKFPHTPKELLTSSFQDMLPREIIDRPKMGFTFPWAIWMRNEMKSFCEENIRSLSQIEAIDANASLELWQRFLNGDRYITWSRIWPLVVLGHWVKQHDVH